MARGNDLLAIQLKLTKDFHAQQFDLKIKFEDVVAGGTTETAGEMFIKHDNRWHLRSSSIPGYLGIKSIAVDDHGLYVETAPPDVNKMRAIIQRDFPLLSYQSAPHLRIRTKENGTTLAEVGQTAKLSQDGADFLPRCMWTIPHAGKQQDEVIDLLDAMYTAEAFLVEEPELSLPAGQMKMEMTLRLDLIQLLQLEQRPILSLKLEGRGEMQRQQQLSLQAVMALQQKLLKLQGQELVDFVLQYTDQHGHKAMQRLFVFVIAGRVKRVRRELTWRTAREVAQKMINKPR